MLEISQQKQKSLIRFVKQGKGVMSTQMWEGVVHLCDLPAQDVPGAGSPAIQAAVSALRAVCRQGPLCARTMVTSWRGWSGKTLFWAQHRAACAAQAPLLEQG